MTLDEYVAWAAGGGGRRHAGAPPGRTLLELGLGFASEVGEVAGVLTRWLRDGELERDRLADELGDVAYYGRGSLSSPEWCPPRCSRAAGRTSNGGRPAARRVGRRPAPPR